MARYLATAAMCLGFLTACGGPAAGGASDRGSGGAGGVPLGTDPGAAFGGAGGVPIQLSFARWEIRTQVWAPLVSEVPSLPAYRLVLDERDGGCDRFDAGHLGPDPHVLRVRIEAPAVGDCPSEPAGRDGCRIHAILVPGAGRGLQLWSLHPVSANLRIARFDGTGLEGTLTATFPVDPETTISSGYNSVTGPSRTCMSATGSIRECRPEAPDEDCCNSGKPLEEIVVPVNAGYCPASVPCGSTAYCAAVDVALSCPVPVLDCEEVCTGLAATCGSCIDCQGSEWCEEEMARTCEEAVAACPAACVASREQRLASIGLACLSRATPCDAWQDCLATCGGTR